MKLADFIDELTELHQSLPNDTEVYIGLDPKDLSPLECVNLEKKNYNECSIDNSEPIDDKKTIVVLSPVWYRLSL